MRHRYDHQAHRFKIAAALISVLGFAAAFAGGGQALASPSQPVSAQARPIRFITQVETFFSVTIAYGEAVSSEGAMNNVEHMLVMPHRFQITGKCDVNANNGSNYNDVRLVNYTLRFDHEISCQNGDAPAQNFFFPHSKECVVPSQVNCKTVHLMPILNTVAGEVEAYVTGLKPGLMADAGYGPVSLLLVDQYRAKDQTDAHILFRDQGGTGTGRRVREISLYTDHGRERAEVAFYR